MVMAASKSQQNESPEGREISPSTIGFNGRNRNGTFAKGNPGGNGNPYNKRIATLRSAVLDAVNENDVREIVSTFKMQAKEGDVLAAKFLFSYAIGAPLSNEEIMRMRNDREDVIRQLPYADLLELAKDLIEQEQQKKLTPKIINV